MVFFGWWMIAAMDVILMVHSGIWYYGLSAFIVPLTQEFGWTRTQISLGTGLSKLETGFDATVTGWLSDHIGPRWTCILCLGLSGILFIALSQVNSLWSFYVLMALVFVLPTSPFTPMVTAVARWFDRKVGTAMGLYSMGAGLSGLLSPVLVFLIIQYSWRTAFTIAGILLLVVCIPLSFVIRNRRPEHCGLVPDGAGSGKTPNNDSADSPIESVEGGAEGLHVP